MIEVPIEKFRDVKREQVLESAHPSIVVPEELKGSVFVTTLDNV